jgi:hypothetical protein
MHDILHSMRLPNALQSTAQDSETGEKQRVMHECM